MVFFMAAQIDGNIVQASVFFLSVLYVIGEGGVLALGLRG